jgi:hypothetical protein
MQALDQRFDQAIVTLESTNYRLRCWVGSYRKDSFRPCAFRQLGSHHLYIASWKQLFSYVFRVLSCQPKDRQQIYNDDTTSDQESEEDSECKWRQEEDMEVDMGDEKELQQHEKDPSTDFTLPAQSDLALSEALMQLSIIFWTHHDSAGMMNSSVLIHFVAVQGIHRHSLAFRTAYEFTPILSRFN